MRVLMPLPSEDFDPTESGVPWAVLADAGHEVVFATPDGRPGRADERMLTGRGLGPWRPLLRADARGRAAYERMAGSPGFQRPLPYADLDPAGFQGLVLPGGHAPGMRPYLESPEVQRLAAALTGAGRPVGAICHGVIVLARAVAPDGQPLLRGRRATALLRSMELTAWLMTGLWLGRYYRTYPQTVEAEVTAALGDPARFLPGPFAAARDAPERLDRGFTVVDDQLVTARWPGDAHRFAHDLLALLERSVPG